MLTYDLRTSILWEYFSTPSAFHVEPETQLVAVDPAVPEPTVITSLQQPGGTFGREYVSCYVAGTSLGRCAFVVNPDAIAEPFPYSGYHHTLILSGAGIFDAGTIASNGPDPPTIVVPKSAIIAFQ